MKKFISRLALTLVIIGVAYFFALPVFYLGPVKGNLKHNKGGTGHMYSRLNEAETALDKDILFLGSSHAYRGFDTELFEAQGFSSFNLGSSGQTPDVTNLLLKRYINNIDPDVVIYEVYPETIFNQSIGSRIDVISNSKLEYFDFLNWTDMGLTEINSKILSFWSNVRDPYFTEKKVKGDDRYVSGGYVRNTKKRRESDNDNEPLIVDIRNGGFDFFLKNIEYLEKFNKEIVLVYAPLPKDTYERYTQNGVIDSIYESIGLPYLNYNHLELDDTLHFKDHNHLNHAGVQLFNQAVIADLK